MRTGRSVPQLLLRQAPAGALALVQPEELFVLLAPGWLLLGEPSQTTPRPMPTCVFHVSSCLSLAGPSNSTDPFFSALPSYGVSWSVHGTASTQVPKSETRFADCCFSLATHPLPSTSNQASQFGNACQISFLSWICKFLSLPQSLFQALVIPLLEYKWALFRSVSGYSIHTIVRKLFLRQFGSRHFHTVNHPKSP